jgi:hypothetical protein
MTTIAWGPPGRSPLWQAVLHVAAVEAREARTRDGSRTGTAGPVRAEPATAVRTGPEAVRRTEPAAAAPARPPAPARAAPAPAVPRAPEIGPAPLGRAPRPRTPLVLPHPARGPRQTAVPERGDPAASRPGASGRPRRDGSG